VVEELARAAADPSTHQYPSYFGLPAFRRAVADFYAAASASSWTRTPRSCP
jgi:aspartate/methionine/tyrosine aminotransferase